MFGFVLGCANDKAFLHAGIVEFRVKGPMVCAQSLTRVIMPIMACHGKLADLLVDLRAYSVTRSPSQRLLGVDCRLNPK